MRRRGPSQHTVRLLVSISLLAVWIAAVAPIQGTLFWLIETPDPDSTATDTSLAIDSAGHPHISYIDYASQTLMYATFEGDDWHVTPLYQIGSPSDSSTSLALDPDGHPHISYYDGHTHRLMYASYGDTNWSTEVADPTPDVDVGKYSSLAIDPSGDPHISYYDATNTALKYTERISGTWTPITIDSDGWSGQYTSLALEHGPNHAPHISYYDAANTRLKYAYFDGENWQLETVDEGSPDAGEYTSLALDSQDRPAIAYHDQTQESLRFAWWTGTAWSYSTVENPGWDVGLWPSLAFNSSDQPSISYYDEGQKVLMYASSTDRTDWLFRIVDNDGIEGEFSSLVIDALDLPHISYFSAEDLSLRYASQLDDPAPPVVTLTASDEDGDSYTFGEWTNKSVQVTMSATDDLSGVSGIFYGLSGPGGVVSSHGYTEPFMILDEGITTITYWALDNAANTPDILTKTVNIDRTAPVVTFIGNHGTYDIGETIEISCQATDNLSGIDTTDCQDISVPTSTLSPGPHTLTATATDLAGNTGSASVTFTVEVTPAYLCQLTQEYVGNPFTGRLLCAPLSLVPLADRLHAPPLKTIGVNLYLAFIRTQAGHTLTEQEYAMLASYARQL